MAGTVEALEIGIMASETREFVAGINNILRMNGASDELSLVEPGVARPDIEAHYTGHIKHRGAKPPEIRLYHGVAVGGQSEAYRFSREHGVYLKDVTTYIAGSETGDRHQFKEVTDEPVSAVQLGVVLGILRTLKPSPVTKAESKRSTNDRSTFIGRLLSHGRVLR